jgi:aspartate/methionine/tyrosine aminotransferase
MAFDEQRLPPAVSLSERAISISSMSKCYGLPGIRTGWLAAKNHSLLDKVLAIREQVSISNNALSEEIATLVLRKKDSFLSEARNRIKKNREVVAEWMQKQDNFEWIYPEAGVVSFPKIKKKIKTEPEKLYRHLAEKFKTFVVPGRCFEMDERHFRIGFGADSKEIRSGLANLNSALNELI